MEVSVAECGSECGVSWEAVGDGGGGSQGREGQQKEGMGVARLREG